MKQKSVWTGIAAAMANLEAWERGMLPPAKSALMRKPDAYYARKARNQRRKNKGRHR